MGAQIEPIDCAEVRWRWDGFLPRSYLFSLAEVESEPTGLQSVPLPRGRLFISPDYECHVDCAGSSYVVLIGHCLDLAHPDCGEPEIARSLLRCAVEHGIDAMLSRMDDLFGRFSLICHVGDRCHVVGDACGTRTIYFAEDRPAVASHSTLLGELTGVAPRRDMFRHYWCALPGNASPVEGVRILPANFILTLGDRTIRRFWPRTSRCERTTSEVIDEVEALLTRVAQATAARWSPALSLTAGLDSRLSLSIYSGLPDLVTFTYDRGVQDTVDADTASRLSKRLGIAHRRLPLVEPHSAPAAYQVQRLISDCPINTNLGPICLNGFRDGNRAFIHVRSSLAEIGRSFWRNHPGMPTTFDPSNWTLVSLSKATAALPLREQAAQYMQDEMRRFFVAAGYDSTDPQSPEIMGYDAWDLCYIEHRMSTWHGPSLMAYDMAFDTSIPFNCRRVVELLLSAPLAARRKATVFHSIIQRRCPEIADIPINPRPRRTPGQLAYGAYRQLRRRAGFLRALEARFGH